MLQLKAKLLSCYLEEPALFAPTLLLWRFEGLGATNHSWAFCQTKEGYVLRQMSAKPLEGECPTITDSTISAELFSHAVKVFTEMSIFPEKCYGIYDGPIWGRQVFDIEGNITKDDSWILGDTAKNLSSFMQSALVETLINWDNPTT